MTPIVILLLCAVCWQAEERAGCTAALSLHRCISNRTHKAAGRRVNRTLNRQLIGKVYKIGLLLSCLSSDPASETCDYIYLSFTCRISQRDNKVTWGGSLADDVVTFRRHDVYILFSFVVHATSVRDHLLIPAIFLQFLCSFSSSCQERVPSWWETNKQLGQGHDSTEPNRLWMVFIWRQAAYIYMEPSTYIFFKHLLQPFLASHNGAMIDSWAQTKQENSPLAHLTRHTQGWTRRRQ